MNLMGAKKVRMVVFPDRFLVLTGKGRKVVSTTSHRRRFIRNRLLSAGFGSINISVKS
jgi:hypothetical protein